MAFAPDGKTLAAGLDDAGDAFLWDLTTRKLRATLPGHSFTVHSLVFTPDSKILATSDAYDKRGGYGDILLWRVDTGKRCGILKPQSLRLTDHDGCWRMAITPDGKTLVGGGGQGTVNLWDLATGKVTRIYDRDENIAAVAISPDGRTLAFLDDWTIHLFDMLIREERAALGSRMPGRYCRGLTFSPDGRTLAVGRIDGCVTLLDLAGVKGAKTPDVGALARLWSRLGPGNAPDAYRAIRTLSAFPRQTVPFLRQQLRPETPPTAAQLRALDRLVPDLDNNDFDVRNKANEGLEKAGTWAEAALRRELTRRHTLDFRKRAKALLERIDHLKASRPLQRLRALEVLEHMDDAGAQALLADLAKTAPEPRLRDDAKASLQRARKRPPPTIIKPLPPDTPTRPAAPPAKRGAKAP